LPLIHSQPSKNPEIYILKVADDIE
jgi:hypothetical protein